MNNTNPHARIEELDTEIDKLFAELENYLITSIEYQAIMGEILSLGSLQDRLWEQNRQAL